MARAVFCLLAVIGSWSVADEPLHVRIDRLVGASHVGAPAPMAEDAEFLRRVTLDLTGTVPSLDKIRAFLADPSPDKRITEIDRLLSSRAFARHMARVFDIALMERQADKHVKTPEWRQFLYQSFLENKPYHQLAREILGADGSDEALRPAVRFYLDRDGEPNRLTRDVGRMFFGKDFQCAQCHDHPLINDYLQKDYYGLFAFLNRSFVFTDAKKKISYYAEKGEGDVTFKSVFTDEGGETGPRLPGGELIDEPQFAKGEEYEVKPAKDVRPVPKFSRRGQLADLATSGANRAFNENIANRLWAHMMGRGLVEPVDLHSSDNPASLPELLALLGDDIAASGFDMKRMLRELALTQTYQRRLDMPLSVAAESGKGLAERRASLEMSVAQCDSKVTAATSAKDQATEQFERARDAVGPLAEALATAQQSMDEAAKRSTEAAASAAASRTKLVEKKAALEAIAKAAAAAREAVAILADEKVLAAAAEQFTTRETGLTQEVSELDKQTAALTQSETTMKAARDAAVAAYQKTLAEHQAASEKLSVARAAREARRAALDEARRLLAVARRNVEESQQLAQFAGAYEQARSARSAAETAARAVADARSELAQLVAELPAKKEEAAAAEEAHRQAQQTVATTAEQLAARRQAAELMVDVYAKSRTALEKLPDDKKLAETTETLKTRSEALSAELASVQQTMTAHQAASSATATRLAAAAKALAENTQRTGDVQTTINTEDPRIGPLTEKAALHESQVVDIADTLLAGWTDRFAVATLKPLTPEQLAWSMMKITGVVDRQRVASAAELNKKTPLPEGAGAEQQAVRDDEIERAVEQKLKGNVDAFVKLFGHAAGQPQGEFFATADQALFFANGGQIHGWLTPSNGNLIERLIKTEEPSELADSLYLGVLGRPPTADESADVIGLIAARPKEKNAVVRVLMWSLLTSVEFRFNH